MWARAALAGFICFAALLVGESAPERFFLDAHASASIAIGLVYSITLTSATLTTHR
jgi:hypothetical protein